MGYFCCAEYAALAASAVSLNIDLAEPVLNNILAIIFAYILGSISFSYIIYKKKTGKDIRDVGSGNAGASNIRRFLGFKYYLLILVLDILKGAAAVMFADYLADDIVITSLAGAAAIMGHSYPVWLKFRGGKSVAVTLGVFIPIGFWSVLIFAAIYFSLVLIFKYVSLGSILGSLGLVVSSWIIGYPYPVRWLALFAFLLIVYRHRSNIMRIFSGGEFKIIDSMEND